MMTLSTIGQQRLDSLRISSSDFTTPAEVVQWLGAVQAQDYASAEWTIGLRLRGATPAVIEEAFAKRALVRTWLLRGTLHIVTAADLRAIRALIAPTLLARFAPVHRQRGLDESTMTKGYAAIAQALQGGQLLTRKELLSTLERAGLALEGQAVSNLLNRAALDGLICLGTMKGKQPTFALLDEWLPPEKELSRDEALAALALRYFTSHGPATLHDFAWWTGLTITNARAGLESVKAQLVEETINGKSYWRSPLPVPTVDRSPSVHLLPGFDEFMLGYSDRSAIVQPDHEKTIMGVNGVFSYTMILDGRVIGIWKRTFRKGAVEIAFSPFAPYAPLAAPIEEAFAAAAQQYGDFLGLPVRLV